MQEELEILMMELERDLVDFKAVREMSLPDEAEELLKQIVDHKRHMYAQLDMFRTGIEMNKRKFM